MKELKQIKDSIDWPLLICSVVWGLAALYCIYSGKSLFEALVLTILSSIFLDVKYGTIVVLKLANLMRSMARILGAIVSGGRIPDDEDEESELLSKRIEEQEKSRKN